MNFILFSFDIENVILNSFSGLKIPEGCSLTVAKVSKPWKEGDCLLFDDSFLHSASNENTDEARVVLMLDLWHPYLSQAEKNALRYIF